MDIRKFFQQTLKPKTSGNGALAAERELSLSPVKQPVKRSNSNRAKACPTILSSDESDGENPLSKDVRTHLKKSENKQPEPTSSKRKVQTPEEVEQTLPSLKRAHRKHSSPSAEVSTRKRTSDASDCSAVERRNSSPTYRKSMKRVVDEVFLADNHKKKRRKGEEAPTTKDYRELLIANGEEAANCFRTNSMEKAPNVDKTSKKAAAVNNTTSKTSEKTKKLPCVDKTAEPRSRKEQPQLSNLPWVDKYKPLGVKQLVGQHTDKSPLNKLIAWLREWPKNNLGEGASQKKPKPSPFAAQNDGTAFKAALLSGPPGIGKTTCAVVACKELGLRYVETNASDARNKKAIEMQVAGLLSNTQINKYYSADDGSISSLSKVKGIDQVLIMDEVDGMSGNQDRAGVAELIQMIKRTKIPIICICNDRQSTKVRSLANHCFDLRFHRPRAEQIKGRLMTIVAQEKLHIAKEALDNIIEASNQDIRQCIYSLQLYATSGSASKQVQKKDVSVNMFEAARRLLSLESGLAEKAEMFFSDYSIMPLFVHENYLNVRASRSSNASHLKAVRRAADLIAFGDIIDKQIRSQGAWNLLTAQAMTSCALPALYLDGYLNGQIQFPSWFGKYSNANKRQRLMRQLAIHTHRKISGSNCALVSDYLPILRERLYRPLIEYESAGVKDVVEVYKSYDLIKDDTEAINELGIWPSKSGKIDISQSVSTKAKSALTRALNKEHRLLPFAQSAPVKGRRKAETAASIEIDEEGHEVVVGGGEGDDDDDEAEGE